MGQIKDMNGNVVGEVKDGDVLGTPFVCVFGADKPRNFKEGETICRNLVGDIKAYVRFDMSEKMEQLPGSGFSSAVATQAIISHMGITEDELFAEAIRNTKGEYKNIFEIAMAGMMIPKEDMPPVWVVNSKGREYYAAGILANYEFLYEFRKEHGDFYIIPCSIHELIFVEADYWDRQKDDGKGYMKHMVSAVNESLIEAGDKLSDTVMRFDAMGLHAI